ADHRAVAHDVDAHVGVVVQAVVLDHVATARASEQPHATPEATNVAVADGGVEALDGVDAVGEGVVAAAKSAELEAVAVDRDVVGGDGDRRAAGHGGAEVLAQAPDALRADGRRDRIN